MPLTKVISFTNARHNPNAVNTRILALNKGGTDRQVFSKNLAGFILGRTQLVTITTSRCFAATLKPTSGSSSRPPILGGLHF